MFDYINIIFKPSISILLWVIGFKIKYYFLGLHANIKQFNEGGNMISLP